MTEDSRKPTIGQAIDQIVGALEALEEASRLTAIRAACEHLGLVLQQPALTAPTTGALHPTPPHNSPAPPHAPAPGTAALRDIRSLKEQKQPNNSFEMACIAAYYLESIAPEAERKSEITTADLEKYFRQAEYPLPKKIAQVLIDAKGAGYFDSAGRGTYKLNAVGHNLVVHKLPRANGGEPRSRAQAKGSSRKNASPRKQASRRR